MSLLAARADAAVARHRLAIPPKPYADALIDLGVQANVSVIGVSACGAGGLVGLNGVYTLEEALAHLTQGAPCAGRIVDPRTIRISPGPTPRPALEPVRPISLIAEVMVTATKRPALVGRLAAGVSVISRDQIELTGASDPSQTVGQAAGVLTTNLGPGRDKLLVRGLSDGAFTGRARSTVATYLDDVPINYNAPDPALRLVDVDRVEVLRGPQGALYGSGSIGGIYRIVTARPEPGRTAGALSTIGAVTEGGDPSHELEGYFNLPLGERAALRLVAYHEVQGGYLDDVNLQLSNVDRTQRDGARAALRLDFADAWRLDVGVTGQRLRSSDTQYTTAPYLSDQRGNQVREAHKNDFGQASATLSGELGWASLASSLAYVRHNYASHYDASSAVPAFLGAGAEGLGLYIERSKVDLWVLDTLLRSSHGAPIGWLAGVYAADADERSPGYLDIQGRASPLTNVYGEARRTRLRELAVYGEGSWEFSPGFTASLGGRLFEGRIETRSDVLAVAPAISRNRDARRRFRGLSPKLSLQREFADGNLLYVLFSEGYRPGGFNTSGLLPIRRSRMDFAADRLRNYELGAKLRLLDRRLGLRAALYYDRWTDIQTDQYRPSGLSYTANVGDARIFGFEAEAGYDFEFGLAVQANVLLSTSDMTRINPDFALRSSIEPPTPILDKLPGVPSALGGVLAVYERPLPHGLTLRLAAEAAYVGSAALSFDQPLLSRTQTPEYIRAKLSAELAAEHWSATLFVSNPTDDDTDTFAYGNPFSFGQVRQVTPQQPRTVGLRLAAAF